MFLAPHSTRIIEVQAEMTQRAVELLNLPPGPAFLLDVGCGSGLSGEELTEQGHYWVGVDISADMLGAWAGAGRPPALGVPIATQTTDLTLAARPGGRLARVRRGGP